MSADLKLRSEAPARELQLRREVETDIFLPFELRDFSPTDFSGDDFAVGNDE